MQPAILDSQFPDSVEAAGPDLCVPVRNERVPLVPGPKAPLVNSPVIEGCEWFREVEKSEIQESLGIQKGLSAQGTGAALPDKNTHASGLRFRSSICKLYTRGVVGASGTRHGPPATPPHPNPQPQPAPTPSPNPRPCRFPTEPDASTSAANARNSPSPPPSDPGTAAGSSIPSSAAPTCTPSRRATP